MWALYLFFTKVDISYIWSELRNTKIAEDIHFTMHILMKISNQLATLGITHYTTMYSQNPLSINYIKRHRDMNPKPFDDIYTKPSHCQNGHKKWQNVVMQWLDHAYTDSIQGPTSFSIESWCLDDIKKPFVFSNWFSYLSESTILQSCFLRRHLWWDFWSTNVFSPTISIMESVSGARKGPISISPVESNDLENQNSESHECMYITKSKDVSKVEDSVNLLNYFMLFFFFYWSLIPFSHIHSGTICLCCRE